MNCGAKARVLMLLALLWLCATAASPPDHASVSLAQEDGTYLLSVTARGASLRALLAEVGRLVGLQIEGDVPTERTVSVEFKRWPLDQALKRLLVWESFVYVSSGSPDNAPSTRGRLILLGRGSARGAEFGEASAASQSGSAALGRDAGVPTRITGENASGFNPNAPLEQLLPFVAHGDPSIRTAALDALASHTEDVRVRRLLIDQISDPDPEIRSLALTLVGSYVADWPEVEDVMMRATRDAVPCDSEACTPGTV